MAADAHEMMSPGAAYSQFVLDRARSCRAIKTINIVAGAMSDRCSLDLIMKLSSDDYVDRHKVLVRPASFLVLFGWDRLDS